MREKETKLEKDWRLHNTADRLNREAQEKAKNALHLDHLSHSKDTRGGGEAVEEYLKRRGYLYIFKTFLNLITWIYLSYIQVYFFLLYFLSC
ncbi:MAG: hypothetical protein V1910_02440 [bacterium]